MVGGPTAAGDTVLPIHPRVCRIGNVVPGRHQHGVWTTTPSWHQQRPIPQHLTDPASDMTA